MRFALTSFIFALFLFGCSDTPDPKPEAKESAPSADSSLSKGAALVLTFKGKVSVVSPSGVNGTAATENQFLSPGDSLVTGEDSDALLLLTNGTTLSVGANTTFELKAFYQDDFDAGKDKVESLKEEASPSTVLIDLKVGDLVVDVKKLRKKSNFDISTPLGVAGIRGTSFRLIALAEATTLSVLTGRVDFVSPANESFQVEASQVILAPKGEGPKVSPLTDEEKQAIQEAVDKAREKADEVELETLKDGLGFKNHVVPSAANLEMIWVEPGTFMMGSPATEEGRKDDENQTQVTLTKGFYLSKYEVTVAQFETVGTPSYRDQNASGDKNLPVTSVNGGHVRTFCDRLTKMEQDAGRLPLGWEYTLPTEAEWEYACRAGTTTPYWWGMKENASLANIPGGGHGRLLKVGSFKPNPWGFHDMSGNVQEWTLDWYRYSYPKEKTIDYSQPMPGEKAPKHRVVRGGNWRMPKNHARSARRGHCSDVYYSGILGFRLALKKIERGPFGSLHSVPSANDLEMIWVEPGTFMMGSPPTEKGREDDENQTQVTLTKGFYLGKYEVTQAQWGRVMGNGSNPSINTGWDRPVENVSWNDAVEFCNKLTEMEREAGRVPEGMAFQLPTEAQWEYACRAGTSTVYSWGDTITKQNANYLGSGFGKTNNVGYKKSKYPANPWGFFDMHGNVREWTNDPYQKNYPAGNESAQPISLQSVGGRVKRGGSFHDEASSLRCAKRTNFHRTHRHNHLGFRLALRKTN